MYRILGSTIFLLFFNAIYPEICLPAENSVFVVNGEVKLPEYTNSCFQSCSSSNCTGVIIESDKCITIDKHNYFGAISMRNYIEKRCFSKIPTKMLVNVWVDRILLDHTQKIVKSENKFECIRACALEKNFPCLSVMFYTESKDCLLNSASQTSAPLKMDTDGFPVSYMELHGLKDSSNCQNSYKMIAFDEMEIRGETKLYDGSGGIDKCIDRCEDCDFILYNEIFKECFLVTYDPSGQLLDFINDEYQILTNACSGFKTQCNATNSLYISHFHPDVKLKAKCLEMCTMSPDCHHVYQSRNMTDCLLSRNKMSLPLVAQKVCADLDDLPDGSAILFDEIGGCGKQIGDLVSKNLELHECMQLCVTHPTRSCESISYTDNRLCYLHDSPIEADLTNLNCSIFTLNVIAFETGKQTKPQPGDSNPKNIKKAKTFASGNAKALPKIDEKKLLSSKSPKSSMNVKLKTHCNFGDITVKAVSENPVNAEMYVRNGHTNCSAKFDRNGEGTLKINHNDTGCPITRNGNIIEAVVVVSQNIGNATVITIDDQLFKVRCDYSNQKNVTAVSKTMNLRTETFSPLKINGHVKVKPINMELRTKRETLKAQEVKIGQSLNLVFHSDKSINKNRLFVKKCVATDSKNDETIVLVKDGCSTQTSREYVLRDEIQETKHGFIIPFRAFRFKKGEIVKIECEVTYCKKCQKPNCSVRTRRFTRDLHSESSNEITEKIHAELLVKVESENYCISFNNFLLISMGIAALILLHLFILSCFCLRSRCLKK